MSIVASQLKIIGKRFQKGKLHAWELGVMLALFNMIILVGFGFLALASFPTFVSWIVFFMVSPVFFVGFWFWFTQEILDVYTRVTLHHSLLVAKIGLFPFVMLLFVSSLSMVAIFNQPISWKWYLLSYNLVLFSAGLLLVGFATLLFGLRHHFRHFLHS